MKLLKYILVALVFVVTTGEAFGQVKVLSGKVSEMFGSTADQHKRHELPKPFFGWNCFQCRWYL